MYKEILNKLAPVVDALDKIEVRGKANHLNLGGCIAVLEDVCHSLTEAISNEQQECQTESNS